MIFRQAEKSDIDTLIQLRLAYIAEDFGELSEVEEQALKAVLPQYFQIHLNRDMEGFLAVEKNDIIGIAMLVIIEKPANPRFITGKTGTVLNVYVKPENRRQGIGTRLISLLIDFAEQQQLDYIELKATKDGYPLYEKLGFMEEKSHYIPMRYHFDRENVFLEDCWSEGRY